MNLLKNIVLIIVFGLEMLLSSTDLWVFSYYSPIIILASYYLYVKKETNMISIILIGTFAIDFLNSRNVGMIAFSFFLALMIVELISSQIAMLDNQSRTLKVVFVVIIYIVIYFGQMIVKNILTTPQVLVLATIYLTTLLISIFVAKKLSKSQKNVIKI